MYILLLVKDCNFVLRIANPSSAHNDGGLIDYWLVNEAFNCTVISIEWQQDCVNDELFKNVEERVRVYADSSDK